MMHVVLDSCVIVAGLRSRQGASYQLLLKTGLNEFKYSISVALLLEYEEVVLRSLPQFGISISDFADVLDHICRHAHRQKVHYLWRPFLSDADDDMILELAVAAGASQIVTFNRKDFVGSEQFGVSTITPGRFLHLLSSGS